VLHGVGNYAVVTWKIEMSRNKSDGATRSPLKTAPLAQAGDSLQKELSDLVMTRGLFPYLVASMMVLFAALEWAQWYWEFPPKPILTTILALIASLVAFLSWRQLDSKAKRLRLGIDGEIAVAQKLEQLRSDKVKVFHDIPGDGFNIDHMLIGPPGVFVIETKTISKGNRNNETVSFDGSRVLVGGRALDRDPITQVVAAKQWVGETLERATGRRPAIRPVVLFPGWFVEKMPPGAHTWVLNPKNLEGFLKHEPACLIPEEVSLFASAMETYMRAKASAQAP
jgi:hypothetical protein